MSNSKAAPPEERLIVLLRHGIAEDATEEKNDEDRGLTAEGHARMKEIARGLESVLPRAQAIFSSPLLRSVQTALWISKAYRARVTVTTADVFAPGVKAKAVAAFLRSIDHKRIVVVGHEPSLTETMRALTGLRGSNLSLKKGGCYAIRLAGDTGSLEWLLPPRALRKLAG
jgi:phosphohistidine phosphatase